MINKVLRGIVHGNTIELLDKSGMTDGEEVVVVLRPALSKSAQNGEGLLRSEGALANDSEWDAIMEEIHQSRRHERRAQWEDK